MEYEPPSYNEYLRATDFARFKFKYGFVIIIIATILLLLLLLFVIMYGKELSTQPTRYIAEKYDLDMCYCSGGGGEFIFNKQSAYYTDSSFGIDNPLID